jgi:spermidine synthase
MLGAGLGHEMPGVLAVLGALFSGMALGTLAGERLGRESLRPARCYGSLELIIGAWGLLSALLVAWINSAAPQLIGPEPAPARQWLVAFLLPAVLLLPMTCAMGASFPVIARCFPPTLPRKGSIGVLYAVNTAGAVTGVLVCTWLLLPALGFKKSVVVLSMINLACGLIALRLRETELALRRPPATQASTSPPVLGNARLALTLAVTGLLGLGYEVLGVRVLAEVLENTIYSFAAVLAVFLIGTAVGGASYQFWLQDSGAKQLTERLFIGLATACLAGVWTMAHGESIYHAALAAAVANPGGIRAAEFLTASAVFLVPTAVMGATFSHLAQAAQGQSLGLGRGVALNTLGSALAPLAFGVVLLPQLGAKWALILLSLSYLLLMPRPGKAEWFWCAAPFLLAWCLPAELQFVHAPPGGKVLAYKQGIMDSVAVVEQFDGNRSLLVNNRFTMGGTGAAVAERRQASIPLLLHPEPRRALFLGLGTGISLAAGTAYPGLTADGVELLPEIVQLHRYFEPENALGDHPGAFRMLVADARRFARACPNQYDVIVADLFHPARDGAGFLYTVEHFTALRARLAPGGLCCQWLPLFQLDESTLRVIVATFLKVFPEARAFLLRFNVDTPVLGMVGTLDRIQYSSDYFAQRVAEPKLAEALAAQQLRDGFQLLGCFVAGPEQLRLFAQGAPLNTDDRPVVLFGAPAFAADTHATSYGRLFQLLRACPHDPQELVGSGPEPNGQFRQRLSAFMNARDFYLQGLAADAEGERARALDLYLQSVRGSPDFPTSYAQCLTLAMQQAKGNPAAARSLLQKLVEAQPNRPVAAQLLERLEQR